MAIGPGKYDSICTAVREETKAEAVILIVIHGLNGSGFTCQANREVTALLPSMLEDMAKQIRDDLKKETH
jgi:hypothetical protein